MSGTGRLALVVGHMAISGGAQGKPPINASEYIYNTDLAKTIKQCGESRGHRVDIFFRDIGGIPWAYRQVKNQASDACIELHFNASNGTVQGTETWYLDLDKNSNIMEADFAKIVQKNICTLFERVGNTDRGVKVPAREDRGYQNLSQLRDIPVILIEPFFGDNAADAVMAVEKKQALAETIIASFEEWLALKNP